MEIIIVNVDFQLGILDKPCSSLSTKTKTNIIHKCPSTTVTYHNNEYEPE